MDSRSPAVATNITIEHNGPEVGMLTTRNFRDILHIGRHKRPFENPARRTAKVA